MLKEKREINFSFPVYNFLLFAKFLDVVSKKFIKLLFLSNDTQKKRFFWERLGAIPKGLNNGNNGGWIWIHANAIGEVNASVRLAGIFKEHYPKNPILITTLNFSADTLARQLNFSDLVLFFPYDMKFIINKFLKKFDPFCVIIVECDVWPNFIKTCKERNIPTFIASGIFSEDLRRSLGLRYLYNYRFRLSGEVLKNIDRFCMQTHDVAQGLSRHLNSSRDVYVTGDLKFSCVNLKIQGNLEYYRRIFNLGNNEPVFVAGNVHKEELSQLLNAFLATEERISGLILILAMRFINDIEEVRSALIQKGLTFVRRSKLGELSRVNERVILLDSIGELSGIYALGKAAFVGGSLVYLGDMFGGHNILEPVRSGVPVIFGCHMHNFRHLAELFCSNKAAIQINDGRELSNWLIKIFSDPVESSAIIQRALNILNENKDVAERTFALIDEKIRQFHSN